MSRTAMATWLSRPIMEFSSGASTCSPYGAKRNTGKAFPRDAVSPDYGAARLHPGFGSHHDHLHHADRLLAPAVGDGAADGALDRLDHRLGIAPARLGEILDGVEHGVVGDRVEPLALGIGLRN